MRFPYLFSGAKYKIAISTWQTLSAGVEDQSDNYFSIVAATTATPSITVVSPNGGEQWTAGNTYPIKIYCSANLPGKTLNISLSNYSTKDFGYILKDLTCRLGDTSTYNWTIPSNYTQGSAFKITVSNDLVSDESNNYFSIISATTTAGSLDISSNVNSPSGTITLDSNRELFRVNFYTYTKGSEDIKVNSLRLCVFKTPNNVPATDADISKLRLYDSMNLTSIMAEGYFATALNGCSQFDNFNWVVPGVGTKTLVVKGDVTNSAVIYLTIEGKYINAVGMSSGKTILVPNSVTSNALTVGSGIIVTPSITVLSPNGGEQWAFGLPQTITWKATGIENGQDVGVYLQFPDGGLCRVAERNALDGIQTVTLSQNQSCPNISKTLASGQYKVFVYWESSVKNERAEDASDNYFNIVAGGYPGFFMTPDKYSYSSGETINLKINRADNKTFPYFVDLFVINQSDSSKNSERYNLDVTSPITVRIHTANSGVFTTSGNYTLLICAGGEVCGAGANTNGTAIYYSAIVPNVSPTAPVIEIPFGDERVIGSGILFSFTSKDPDEKNQLQFYIVWGDGSSDTCLATATGGSAVCAKLHAYSNAGTYRITADVVDSNGGAPREVSTFDVVINDASVGSITSENQLADISSALLKMADEINKLLGR